MEERMTNQLSGGQQQRVALARALVMQPGVLLFDEPLSNLDAKLRVTMRTEIRKIQQKLGITAIYVTHDQSEAMSLSDENVVVDVNGIDVKAESYGNLVAGDLCKIVLRPENVQLTDTGNAIPCEVVFSTFMGAYQYYQVKAENTIIKINDYNPRAHKIYKAGDKAYLNLENSKLHVL